MSSYTIITNGTNELVQTDGSGNLPALSAVNLTNIPGANITPGTVGVAAMNASGTPSSTTFLRGDGTWSVPLVSNGVQVFSSSGTFTLPAGITSVDVEVIGGGGGTGGTNAAGYASGAGGGGGYSRKRISGLTPGDTVTVTVGAGGTDGAAGSAGGNGGTSSFGSYSSASGGNGGAAQSSGLSQGGGAGIGSGGDINLLGGEGGDSLSFGAAIGIGGGGSTILGAGTPSFVTNAITNSAPGCGFGGGAGGVCGASGGGNLGAAGAVIVRW